MYSVSSTISCLTMCWVLVIWLLGAGGMFPEVQADPIIEINKNNKNTFEGDIILHETSSFSSTTFLWPWRNGVVQVPYVLHDAYNDNHKIVLMAAFKDMADATCIHFVPRKTEVDYISIEPREGCYSNVGRVGGKQLVSLSYECVRKGKGVVLHELLHVIGFWHEHSRADRDKYVLIIWRFVLEGSRRNFCKHETTNMLTPYDYGSLLQYSSTAFSTNGNVTIQALLRGAEKMGQRIKLSDSDILRVNKLYHCPQYVYTSDDDEDVEEIIETSLVGDFCSETNFNDFANSLVAPSLSLSEQIPVSPLPNEKPETSKVALNSSSLESTSSLTQEPKLVPTQEPTYSITGLTAPNGGATLESPKRTAAPQSIQDNSTVSIPHQATDQLQNGTFVTSSESNIVTGHKWNTQVEVHATAFLKSSVTGEENGTKSSTVEMASTMTASTLTDAIQPTSISMTKRTLANIDIMEANTISARSQSSTMQKASTEEPFASSGSGEGSGEASGEVPNDPQCVKKSNLQNIVRKRSLVGKRLGLWSEHHPRLMHGNKLTLSYNNKRKQSSEIEPFCRFEHALCGWHQSAEDDLDWKLSWRDLNGHGGYRRPKGFRLSLKGSPAKAVSELKAQLLKPIVQPSNCISFWYGSRHSNMGTLNVYVSSGKELTLLWSSEGQDNVRRTKAQIMLPPHLLSSDIQVIVEGVVRPSVTSSIAIGDLFVGQCS